MKALKRLIVITIPALRFLLGGLFVYAGAAKLLDVPTFAAQLQLFGLANQMSATFVAHYLPFLEIACGSALVIRRFTLGAIALYLSLLGVFELGLAYAWGSGIQADCGCFGTLVGGTSIQVAFVKNLGLLGIGAIILMREVIVARRSIE